MHPYDPIQSIHTYQTGLECIYNFELEKDGLLCCGVGGIEILRINTDSGFHGKSIHLCNDNINSSGEFYFKPKTLLHSYKFIYMRPEYESLLNVLAGSWKKTFNSLIIW